MTKEIIIIGAGTTGLSAAIFLHNIGFQPIIFEKRDRSKITKAIGINPVTLQLFEPLGITKQFQQNGWQMHQTNFWYEDSLVYENHFSKITHPFPFMVIQPQFETEQILENYLFERGIEVRRNIELSSISKTEKGNTLQFKNLQTNENFSIETEGLILGADGNKSKVREETKIAFDGWEHPAEFTLYDIELETSLNNKIGHYRFFKDGAMLMLHIRNGVWRVGGNIENILEYLPKGSKTGKISWETNFKISERVAQKYNEGNIFILGDAAHIHSPLGGKGMNMCIEDSHVFAQLLKEDRLNAFSEIRRNKVKNTIGILGQLTEIIGGKHFIGSTLRSNMKHFKFLFPIFMPYMRKFLLGLK